MKNQEMLWTKEQLMQGIKAMNDCGLRYTGSKGHKEFVEYLKKQANEIGCETVVTDYKFDRWEAKEASIKVDGETIKVSSPFPYSGVTSDEGVSGELKLVANNFIGHASAKGKIGVVRIKNLSKISSKIAFDKRKSIPEDLEIEPSYTGPVSTSFVKTILYPILHQSNMKALILVWEDMSDAMVEGQYLNFILNYLKIPVVWVNESEGKKLIKFAKEGKTATVRLIADLEKECDTQSFYSIIKGTSEEKEAIIVNTHTDGNNCVEENGAIAMLAMMDYFKKNPIEHTLIFVFVTGHFRLHNFKTGVDQATSRWLADNKEVWKGTNGGKVFAGVSVEHLGCTEWKDVKGEYTKTDDIDVELVYTGNEKMDSIYYEAIKDRTLLKTMTLRGHNMLHFGEGQPLFNKGIPEIALVTAPNYLCQEAEDHQLSKFNLDLFYQQTQTFVNVVELLDKENAESLGKAQFYSIGLGSLK